MLVLRHAEAYSRDSRDNRWLKIFFALYKFQFTIDRKHEKRSQIFNWVKTLFL